MNNTVKDIYYTVLNAITLGKGIKKVVNNIEIIFPARYYKYYENDYESESFKFIQKNVKPGNLVLDIGGHIGLYAVAFGKLVQQSGKVYSFEPTPSTNKILRKTIELNNLQQIVSVQNEAISKEKGESIFYISDDLTDNSNSLVNGVKTKTVNGIKVHLNSIDEFAKELNKKIDFIKIDIEGAELDAILGAHETLSRDKPLCILALHPYQIKSKGDSLEQIWDAVVNNKYSMSFQGSVISKEFFCRQENLFDVWLQPL